jgi:HEAT repeat protein
MKISRIVGFVFFGVLVVPLLFTQAQPEPARQEARTMLKDIKKTLYLSKPGADTIHSLKTLQAIAEEMQAMHLQVEFSLNNADPAVRRQAALTLAEMSRTPDNAAAAVEKLTKRLSKEVNGEVREDLLIALYRMGPHAAPALPKVLEAFKNDDAPVRRRAIIVMGNFLPQDKELLAVMISALDDPDSGPYKDKPGFNSVSTLAMYRLGQCGRAAKDAVPKLKRIAKGGDFDYRWTALVTLTSVAPEDPLTLEVARGYLKQKDSPAEMTKGTSLAWRLGPHAKKAVPELIAILQMAPLADRLAERQLKVGVLSALKSIGPDAKEALPVLRAMMGTDTRGIIAETIKGIEGKK